VIGPKGKVINTIQQETGAEINVSDDGATGIITIGSPDNAKVEDAKARILAIVDPPTADLGATYTGRVVNIAQFGAFVNILPGRDGLVHISKLGNGQRIAKVEDVLNIGDEVQVRVDDIDDRGKVSLSLIGPDGEPMKGSGSGPAEGGDRGPRPERSGGDRGGRNDRGGNSRGGDRGGNSRGGNSRGGNDRGGSGRGDNSARREPNRGSRPAEPVSDNAVSVSFEEQFDSEFNG
jgi:polyribonucleotide nucleotidyltransferase